MRTVFLDRATFPADMELTPPEAARDWKTYDLEQRAGTGSVKRSLALAPSIAVLRESVLKDHHGEVQRWPISQTSGSFGATDRSGSPCR
jgi:hypothetical protein